MESFRRLLRLKDPVVRHEPLATLGDSLGLFRRHISTGGSSGGRFDVADFEREELVVGEPGVVIEIFAGEMVCLLGGNASGKTTTLKTILGYVRPSAGEVLLDGDVISGLTTTAIVRKGISMVPENRRLFGEMTVAENLELGAYQRSDKEKIAQDRERILTEWRAFMASPETAWTFEYRLARSDGQIGSFGVAVCSIAHDALGGGVPRGGTVVFSGGHGVRMIRIGTMPSERRNFSSSPGERGARGLGGSWHVSEETRFPRSSK